MIYKTQAVINGRVYTFYPCENVHQNVSFTTFLCAPVQRHLARHNLAIFCYLHAFRISETGASSWCIEPVLSYSNRISGDRKRRSKPHARKITSDLRSRSSRTAQDYRRFVSDLRLSPDCIISSDSDSELTQNRSHIDISRRVSDFFSHIFMLVLLPYNISANSSLKVLMCDGIIRPAVI